MNAKRRSAAATIRFWVSIDFTSGAEVALGSKKEILDRLAPKLSLNDERSVPA